MRTQQEPSQAGAMRLGTARVQLCWQTNARQNFNPIMLKYNTNIILLSDIIYRQATNAREVAE
jgi:hypothetical protein